MVARATSTIAWCAVSDKPLVFIDIPWDKPLRQEARQAFEEAFFVFDASSPHFFRDVREFLSQPLEEIESQWQTKAVARKSTVEQFFGCGGKGAGRRAATYIVDNILV